jgi:hypothetical protein
VSSQTEEARMEGVEAFRRRVESSRRELAGLPRSGWGDLGPPDPETGERWDRGHVLGHLAEMLPFWTGQVRAVLTGATALGRGDEGWARRREGIDGGRDAGVEELVQRVDQGLSGLLGLLAELRDEDLGRAVVYRDGGRSREVTLRTAIEERLVGHVEAHLRQIARLG